MSDMWPLQLSLVKSRLGLDQLLRAHCKKKIVTSTSHMFLNLRLNACVNAKTNSKKHKYCE